MSAHTPASLERGTHRILQTRRPAARKLPPSEVRWVRRDQPDTLDDALDLFRRRGVVEIVDRTLLNDSPANVYRTKPAAEQYVDGLDVPKTPCDHSGVRCIEAGETYTCCNEDCDCRFGPDIAREEIYR